jgi:hypothetical protein
MAHALLLLLVLAVMGLCFCERTPGWRPDFRIRDPLQIGGEIVAIFSGQSALKAYLSASAEDFPGWAAPVTAAPLLQGGGQELLLATAVVSGAWLLAAVPRGLYAQRMPPSWAVIFDTSNDQLVGACNITLTALLLLALTHTTQQPVDVATAGSRLGAAYPFLLLWRYLYSSAPPTLL